jgi:hypothetical protein
MAFSAVLLAALVGFCVATYATMIGDVGVLSAVGLYIAAGWAVIFSLFGSTLLIRLLRKVRRVVIGGPTEQVALATKQGPRGR